MEKQPWNSVDLKPLFAGSDDEYPIFALYRRMMHRGGPRNNVQRTFYLAWEATELLNSDGFEYLVDQDPGLEAYAIAFDQIGMPQVKPIFERVTALIPAHLRLRENEEAMHVYLREKFDDLQNLLSEFFGASAEVLTFLGRFVREHKADFAVYAGD